MLYDNALLIRLYLHGWQLTGADRVPPGARRDDRLRAPRPPPAGRRLLLGRGRRQRGRGGQVLRLDRRRGARGARRPTPTPPSHWYGFRPGGNFEHGTTIPNRMHARGDLARPPEVERRARGAVRGPRRPRPPRPRRQGAHRVERLPRGHAGRGGRGGRRAGVGRRGGRDGRVPARQPAPRRRPLAALVAGRGRRAPPRLRHRPRRPRRRLHPAGRGHRRGPLDRRGPRRPPTPCSTCSGTTSTAACSPPATTPRRSSPAPRT